ncbi:hypothetical protein CPS_4460 [Colwellia psychrerythraea 34H]|uniref:Uncharacterized protein n=1 Tax=Colwellia psychrerythraea (strain 34H / ATCC BAA-681) TaxID=167879 RepID=Q47VR4_COLP3|nr:hypothetical protein CPS_4460 [Colwellia psychrerythraea 34H]
MVTTATVKIPISFAISATTGAAPVPVPPPIPAAINIISAPCKACLIVSRSSSAAQRPISGFAPAPNPLVTSAPSCKVTSAEELRNACESVFAVTNSTPSIVCETMCSTALPPPPPTPITLIIASSLWSSINSNIFLSPFYLQ